MYKFYICEFKNKRFPMKDGDVFVKFGITHHWDVMDRFNPAVDDGYDKNYHDWEITCKFSWALPSKADAERMERYWLEEKFPKSGKNKVWVENYFGLQDNNYYYDNTGVTELRLVTEKQAKWIYYTAHQMKKGD